MSECEEYTPTMDEIKNWYAGGVDEYWCDTGMLRDEAEAAFDRAIAAHDRALREQVARAYGIGDLTSRPLRDAQDEIKRLENLVRSLRRENRRLENTIARRDQRCEDLAAVEQQRLATLALVEQQRIANLIALGHFRVCPNELQPFRHLVMRPVNAYDVEPTTDIAAALGIGDDDE